MLKKFLSVSLLAVALIFFGSQEKVSAYDVYCGTYRDGNKAYLMTETIQTNDSGMYCTVKAVKGNNVTYIYYKFGFGRGIWYSNSQGFSGECTQYGTPIAWNIQSEASRYW